jgi:hypothetical protein
MGRKRKEWEEKGRKGDNKMLSEKQNREELRKRGTIGVKNTTCRQSGKNIISEGGYKYHFRLKI